MATREIEPLELKRLRDSGEPICLIDVRQPEEHELVKIDGSILIPLDELESRLDELRNLCRSTDLVVLYCRSGKRSAIALEFLGKSGINGKLTHLRGGINAYAREVDRSLEPY